MLLLPPAVRIFVATFPVDMRRSFDGLSVLARDVLAQDPLSGHLFVFFNKNRDRVKVRRKNWLFAGSERGAEAAANIYSLVYACKLLKLDPWRYLRDVVEALPTHPQSPIDELTPAGYAEQLREKVLALAEPQPAR